MFKKTKAWYHHQDFLFEYFFVKKYDNDYLCVSFTAVVVVLLFDREIFGPKILIMETTISFLSEGLAVGRLSRNQFKPVLAETVKNYPVRKLEFLSPQSRYIGHQCGI